jgi:hypothetical protein
MFRWKYFALILGAEIFFLVLVSFLVPVAIWLFLSIIPLTLAVFLLLHRLNGGSASRMRQISPEDIIRYTPKGSPLEQSGSSPDELSRLIVERTAEIRRTLQESPSEVQIEMCALGYHACVNDMITLTHLTNEELPEAGFLRRFALRRSRKKATAALTGTREALPQSALRATPQEQQ